MAGTGHPTKYYFVGTPAASLACLLQAPVRQGYVGPYRYGRMRTGTSAGRPGSHLTIASRPLEPRSNLAQGYGRRPSIPKDRSLTTGRVRPRIARPPSPDRPWRASLTEQLVSNAAPAMSPLRSRRSYRASLGSAANGEGGKRRELNATSRPEAAHTDMVRVVKNKVSTEVIANTPRRPVSSSRA